MLMNYKNNTKHQVNIFHGSEETSAIALRYVDSLIKVLKYQRTQYQMSCFIFHFYMSTVEKLWKQALLMKQ